MMRTREWQGSLRTPPPTILVLSSAIDVIRREVVACPVETGGVLLGRWSADGEALLVTGAGGPGPRARHERHRFSADLTCQQALVADHHARFGVGYVGEWHKHPPKGTSPSPTDGLQLVELLEAEGERLRYVLAPIVTLSPARWLQIFPYLAVLEGKRLCVQPCRWHEVRVVIEEDLAFAGWQGNTLPDAWRGDVYPKY